MPRRVLIMGAAGRDFHNFNVVFRDDPPPRSSRSPPRDPVHRRPDLSREARRGALLDGIRIHEEDEPHA